MDFFSFTGWLFGLLGLLVAIYAYLRTRNVVKLGVRSKVRPGLASLTALPDAPSIQINNTNVPGSITIVESMIANTGTSTIRRGDVVEPLRMRPIAENGAALLFWRVSSVKGPRNKSLAATAVGDALEITWDYLDPRERIKVLTVYAGEVKGANFDGQLLGGGRIVKWRIQDDARVLRVSAMLAMVYPAALFGPIGAVMLARSSWPPLAGMSDINIMTAALLLTMVAIFVVVGAFSVFVRFVTAAEKAQQALAEPRN